MNLRAQLDSAGRIGHNGQKVSQIDGQMAGFSIVSTSSAENWV
ncbi:MAG: hypothetical protein DDT29_00900 [Dehalococcoidia bacterium]|nr:hypothetical protein [Bacillota bacterium]